MSPPPQGYLVYKVVDTITVWVRDAENLMKPGDVLSLDQLAGNHLYISFEAAEALGRAIQVNLKSSRVSYRPKSELLGVALTTQKDLESAHT